MLIYLARYIEELIEKEIAAGIPSERVVVAGFSQGGAVALMALRSEHKLAGVVGECRSAAILMNISIHAHHVSLSSDTVDPPCSVRLTTAVIMHCWRCMSCFMKQCNHAVSAVMWPLKTDEPCCLLQL